MFRHRQFRSSSPDGSLSPLGRNQRTAEIGQTMADCDSVLLDVGTPARNTSNTFGTQIVGRCLEYDNASPPLVEEDLDFRTGLRLLSESLVKSSGALILEGEEESKGTSNDGSLGLSLRASQVDDSDLPSKDDEAVGNSLDDSMSLSSAKINASIQMDENELRRSLLMGQADDIAPLLHGLVRDQLARSHLPSGNRFRPTSPSTENDASHVAATNIPPESLVDELLRPEPQRKSTKNSSWRLSVLLFALVATGGLLTVMKHFTLDESATAICEVNPFEELMAMLEDPPEEILSEESSVARVEPETEHEIVEAIRHEESNAVVEGHVAANMEHIINDPLIDDAIPDDVEIEQDEPLDIEGFMMLSPWAIFPALLVGAIVIRSAMGTSPSPDKKKDAVKRVTIKEPPTPRRTPMRTPVRKSPRKPVPDMSMYDPSVYAELTVVELCAKVRENGSKPLGDRDDLTRQLMRIHVAELEEFIVPELREMCSRRSLAKSGRRAELVQRLVESGL